MLSTLLKKYTRLFLILFFACLANISFGHTYYVNKSAGDDDHNGESWSNAFKTLAAALRAADREGGANEIWVAAGDYYPDEGPHTNNNNKSQTFDLLNNTKIYGGFSGSETSLSQRNWTTNKSYLNGAIDKNKYAYHVVHCNDDIDDTAVLNGFYIKNGDADSHNSKGRGGAILIEGGSPQIINCYIFNSAAYFGGGVYVDGGSPTFNSCIIHDNTAYDDGGGVYNNGGSPTYDACLFFNNNSLWDDAGAIYNNGNNSTFIACSIYNNGAVDKGGGAYNNNSSTVTYTNCDIYSNTCSDGAAFYNNASAVSIENCEFTSNAATGDGGAMKTVNNCSITITASTFTSNSASTGAILYGSGSNSHNITSSQFFGTTGSTAIHNDSGTFNFTGCLVSGNRVSNNFLTSGSANNYFTSCTIAGNKGGQYFFQFNEGNAFFNSCVIWNPDIPALQMGGGAMNFKYCLIEKYGILSTNSDPTNLLGTDPANNPRFFAPEPGSNAPTSDGDYSLQANSSLINMGDPNGNSLEVDLMGNPRVNSDRIDIGAFEFQADTLGYCLSTYGGFGPNFSGQNLAAYDFTSFPADSLKYANFQGANLTGANFSGMDLTGINFYGASLSSESQSANFSETILDGGCFVKSEIEGANISDAELASINFSNLQVENIDFSGSNFSDNSFFNATMQNVNMQNTQLSAVDFSYLDMTTVDFGDTMIINLGADGTRTKFNYSHLIFDQFPIDKWVDSTCWGSTDLSYATIDGLNAGNCSFQDRIMTGAILSGLDFTGFNFYNATLDHALLNEATLTNANMNSASLKYADLSEVEGNNIQLNNGYLNSAVLSSANFISSSMDNAQFELANLESIPTSGFNSQTTDFSNASLQLTKFANASIDGVNFSNANLAGAKFESLTLHQTNFSGATLSDANFDGTTMESVNFSNAKMEAASFIGADLSQTGGSGYEMDFSCAQLGGANFTSANISGATFLNAIMLPQDSCCMNADGTYYCGTMQYENDVYGQTYFPVLTDSVTCPNSFYRKCNGADWIAPNWFVATPTCPNYWIKPDCLESGGGEDTSLYITFTDPNLQTCIGNKYFNGNTDQHILKSWAAGQTDLDISSCDVNNLGGLEYFTGLIRLDASENSLSGSLAHIFDSFPQLQELYINDNQLASISISNTCSFLKNLYVFNNNLSQLSLGSGIKLSNLDASHNLLRAFQLNTQPRLVTADLSFNSLDTVGDVSGLTLLTQLNLSNNDLTSIGDISSLCCVSGAKLTLLNLYCNHSFVCSSLGFPPPSGTFVSNCQQNFVTDCNQDHDDCPSQPD